MRRARDLPTSAQAFSDPPLHGSGFPGTCPQEGTGEGKGDGLKDLLENSVWGRKEVKY